MFFSFEIEVLKYLMRAPLQLHPDSCTYVKFYQYRCEYLNGKPSMILFFHLFKFCCGSVTQACGRGLVYLEPTVRDFRPILELQHFKNQFFLVTPTASRVHATICAIGDGV